MQRKIVAFLLMFVCIVGLTACRDKMATQGGDYTIKWLVPGDKQPDIASVLEKVNEVTVEKIGAKIDLQFIDTASYQERLRMNMASQNAFDMCQIGDHIYNESVKRNGLYDITQFVEEDSALDSVVPEYAWEALKINKKIYAVPNVQIFAICSALEFRTDLIEKYNFDITKVKNIQDLEPFLKLIKENEPDYIPMKTFGQLTRYPSEFTNYSAVRCVVDKNGKVTAMVNLKEFREASDMARDWFNKGYFRADSATVGSDSADVLAGKYAVRVITSQPGIESEDEASLGIDLSVQPIGKPTVSTRSITATMTGISATSINPEKTWEFIKLINTDKDLYNLICFGIEGKHYEVLDDGHIRLKTDSGYSPNACWKFGCQLNALLLEGQPDDIWEETQRLNKESERSSVFGFTPDIDAIRTEVAQWTAVFGEYDLMTYTGAEDPNSYWSEFERRSKEAGVDKVEKEIQRQVDEFLAAKKK